MQLQVDAWLERKDPLIRLMDAESGRELVRLGSDVVRELIDSGEICPQELAIESPLYTEPGSYFASLLEP